MYYLLLLMLLSAPDRIMAYGPGGNPTEFANSAECEAQRALTSAKLRDEGVEPFITKCVAVKALERGPLVPSGEVW
jgi:hypothetical protein